MEQEKKISTFTSEEKEAMEKFNSFEAGLSKDLGENEKVTKINFYNGANLKDGIGRNFDFEGDLFLVEKEAEDGTKKTFIYAGSPDNIIGFVDENGNIEFADEELKSLGITMTLEEFKEVNLEKLLVKSEELTPEELQEYLEKEKQDGKDKEENEEEKENESPEDEMEEAEEELSEKSGNDYRFYFYKKITKPGLANEISGSKGKNLAFAIDSNKGAMIIDTETGERLQGTRKWSVYNKNCNYNK